jgi:uncharacterized protein DUF3467
MDQKDVDRPQLNEATRAKVDVDRSHRAKGEYADYFEVGHDFVAFYVDWGQQAIRDEDKTTVHSRIVTSPIGAINLLGVLAQALCKYARSYHAFPDDKGTILPQSKQMEEALCEYVRRFVENKPNHEMERILIDLSRDR